MRFVVLFMLAAVVVLGSNVLFGRQQGLPHYGCSLTGAEMCDGTEYCPGDYAIFDESDRSFRCYLSGGIENGYVVCPIIPE